MTGRLDLLKASKGACKIVCLRERSQPASRSHVAAADDRQVEAMQAKGGCVWLSVLAALVHWNGA